MEMKNKNSYRNKILYLTAQLGWGATWKDFEDGLQRNVVGKRKKVKYT